MTLRIEEQHIAPACILTLEHDGEEDNAARRWSVWAHSFTHAAVQLIPATSRAEAHATFTVLVMMLRANANGLGTGTG